MRRRHAAPAVVPAVLAILGWAFAEWLIVAPCSGAASCTSRSWGGHYVPLQAALAVAGVTSAAWLILRALERRPLRRPLVALLACAAAWGAVVQVHVTSG